MPSQKRTAVQLPPIGCSASRSVILVNVGDVWWCRSAVDGKFCAFRITASGTVATHINVTASGFIDEQLGADAGCATYLADVEFIRIHLRKNF